jgi:hypothetical protein
MRIGTFRTHNSSGVGTLGPSPSQSLPSLSLSLFSTSYNLPYGAIRLLLSIATCPADGGGLVIVVMKLAAQRDDPSSHDFGFYFALGEPKYVRGEAESSGRKELDLSILFQLTSYF